MANVRNMDISAGVERVIGLRDDGIAAAEEAYNCVSRLRREYGLDAVEDFWDALNRRALELEREEYERKVAE